MRDRLALGLVQALEERLEPGRRPRRAPGPWAVVLTPSRIGPRSAGGPRASYADRDGTLRRGAAQLRRDGGRGALGEHRPGRAGAVEPGPRARARPRAPLPRGHARGRRRPTCSRSTRSTSGRAGSRRCASGRAARATSPSRGRWRTASAREARGPTPSCARSTAGEVAAVLGQDPGHELMALYARALNDLGRVPRRAHALDRRRARRRARRSAWPSSSPPGCRSSATRASSSGRRSRRTTSRWRASPSSTTSTGSRSSRTTSCRTCCAWTGCCATTPDLAARIDAGELLPPGEEEREIRACAVHACELIAARLGVPPRDLDMWLWNRGQAPRYKALPRHRTRTVFY